VSIGRRIEKLEATLPSPANGLCFCGGLAGKDIRIYDGPDSEADADRDTQSPSPCETCGGGREALKIVVINPQQRAA
jgi:hypothetical protein